MLTFNLLIIVHSLKLSDKRLWDDTQQSQQEDESSDSLMEQKVTFRNSLIMMNKQQAELSGNRSFQ